MFPIFTMLSTTSRKFFKQSVQEPNLSHERSTYSAVAFKHGTPVTLCVLVAYIEATFAREGYYICSGYKKDVNFRCS